jgi:hypothetical protein
VLPDSFVYVIPESLTAHELEKIRPDMIAGGRQTGAQPEHEDVILGISVVEKNDAPVRLCRRYRNRRGIGFRVPFFHRHALPSLQKLCGSRIGWPATKTLEVAQELYDGQGKKIIT